MVSESINYLKLEDEEDQYKRQLERLKTSVPFAIVGSTETFEVKGKRIRGRLYPWGVVEIENPSHSDFSLLRSMLISHMQDLQEVTHDLHYENYRASVLSNRKHHQSSANVSGGGGQQIHPPAGDDGGLEAKELEIQRMKEMMAQMEAQLHAQQKTMQRAPPPPPPQRGDKYKHLDV